MTIVYDIQKLTKTYPKQSSPANNDISLQITQGEIFGLLGDNGAGKSTLVKQLVNLLQPDSGAIHLFGKNICQHPMLVPMQVGYMPQDSAALNKLTIGEALYFTAHLRGLTRRDAKAERERQLALWQLAPLRHHASDKLSGGQKRLFRLAVATAGLPPVLLLDEPTNDLDPKRRKLVWDTLRQINDQYGTTIIFITHDALEAEKVIERVGIMRAGRLVANGRISQLKQQLNQNVRIDLFTLDDSQPAIPPQFEQKRIGFGHWAVWADKEAVNQLINQLDLEAIADFRMQSATLEDLYLHYAT